MIVELSEQQNELIDKGEIEGFIDSLEFKFPSRMSIFVNESRFQILRGDKDIQYGIISEKISGNLKQLMDGSFPDFWGDNSFVFLRRGFEITVNKITVNNPSK